MEHKWADIETGCDFAATLGDGQPLKIVATIDESAVEQPEVLYAIPGYFSREFFRLAAHEDVVRKALRIECAELGDNDWPDDLHLADVIEKHLARPTAARIADLETENRRLFREVERLKGLEWGARQSLTRAAGLEAENKALKALLAEIREKAEAWLLVQAGQAAKTHAAGQELIRAFPSHELRNLHAPLKK